MSQTVHRSQLSDSDEQQVRGLRTWASRWLSGKRAWSVTVVVSFGLHALVLIAMGWWPMPIEIKEEIISLFAVTSDEDEVLPEPEVDIAVQPDELIDKQVDDSTSSINLAVDDLAPEPFAVEINQEDIVAAVELIDAEAILGTIRGDFGGRSEKGRRAALIKFGGSADSERAVNQGLEWIASIQQKDGGWDFNDVGEAGGAGSLANGRMGATAMALLCFLGSGHSHASGTRYQKQVTRGLRYLIKNKKVVQNEADLRGNELGNGGMYIQGLGTIALCEAHALTRLRNEDKQLRQTAQDAVRFIENAQDKQGGGWRYRPNQPGDTSVVGWQIMALKSAQASRLKVDSKTLTNARKFLQSVQVNGGAMYGYTGPQPGRPGTTAIGLLCRMYLGWRQNEEALGQGVAFLSKEGPKRDDMYYNYYATQVLHHWGGVEWKKWNDVMRPMLVNSQVQEGPAAGSWKPRDRHAGPGGRLYETALCLMTLEVYYRHMPLYRKFE